MSGMRETAVAQSFKTFVERRLARDPEFRKALLRESVETMLSGDLETGRAVLRDYIEAMMGLGSHIR
jgi:hypothetical protein